MGHPVYSLNTFPRTLANNSTLDSSRDRGVQLPTVLVPGNLGYPKSTLINYGRLINSRRSSQRRTGPRRQRRQVNWKLTCAARKWKPRSAVRSKVRERSIVSSRRELNKYGWWGFFDITRATTISTRRKLPGRPVTPAELFSNTDARQLRAALPIAIPRPLSNNRS